MGLPRKSLSGRVEQEAAVVVGPPRKLVEPVLSVRKEPTGGQPVLEHFGPTGQGRELLEEGRAWNFVSIDPQDPVATALSPEPGVMALRPVVSKAEEPVGYCTVRREISRGYMAIGDDDDLVRHGPEQRQDRVHAIAGILGEAADRETQLREVKQAGSRSTG